MNMMMQMLPAFADMATGAMDKAQGDFIAFMNYLKNMKASISRRETARNIGANYQAWDHRVEGSLSRVPVADPGRVNQLAMKELFPFVGVSDLLGGLADSRPAGPLATISPNQVRTA